MIDIDVLGYIYLHKLKNLQWFPSTEMLSFSIPTVDWYN